MKNIFSSSPEAVLPIKTLSRQSGIYEDVLKNGGRNHGLKVFQQRTADTTAAMGGRDVQKADLVQVEATNPDKPKVQFADSHIINS